MAETTVAADGSWCWFADPRGFYHKGSKAERSYFSYITSTGDVGVSAFDHGTGAACLWPWWYDPLRAGMGTPRAWLCWRLAVVEAARRDFVLSAQPQTGAAFRPCHCLCRRHYACAAVGKWSRAVVHAGLGSNDHNNPALLLTRDGHIAAFYSQHNGKASSVGYSTSLLPPAAAAVVQCTLFQRNALRQCISFLPTRRPHGAVLRAPSDCLLECHTIRCIVHASWFSFSHNSGFRQLRRLCTGGSLNSQKT